MNSIRVHPAVAGLALAGLAFLALARGQQSQRLPVLTPEQAEILSHLSIVYLPDGMGNQRKTIRVAGVNLQVVDGSGSTSGNLAPGLGNVIIGYDEFQQFAVDKTGCHNLVLGPDNSYWGFAGIVSGYGNRIGPYCNVISASTSESLLWGSVIGGIDNEAYCGVVVSGSKNKLLPPGGGIPTSFNAIIAGEENAISGGLNNAVVGGGQNTLSVPANGCVHIGGLNNEIGGAYMTGAGGQDGTSTGVSCLVLGATCP